MMHFIKNLKGKPQEYLGMSGPNLVEILDNDPFLLRVLKSKQAKVIYSPSVKSRFTGNHQRMVLMAKENDALFSLKKLQSPKGYLGIELGILNTSNESLAVMVKEVTLLARLRWPNHQLFIRLDLHKNIQNLKTTLFNLGWIEDEHTLMMEKKF